MTISFLALGLSHFIDDIGAFSVGNDGNYGVGNGVGACKSAPIAVATTSVVNSKDYSSIKCDRRYSARSIMLRHTNHECGVAK